MHRSLVLILALVAGVAQGQDKVYERGEFRFSVGPTPAFVQEQTVPVSWPANVGSSDDRWRNWLVDRQIDRRPDQQVIFVDRAYEAVSPELVQEVAKVDLSFNPLYQKLTLHRVEVRRDGQWSNRLDIAKVSLARRETDFEQNMSDGQVTALLVLDDVRVRDIIRVTYSVTGTNPILAGQVSDKFVLGWSDPMLLVHGLVVFPPGSEIAVKSRNSAVRPTEKKLSDRIEVSFVAQAVEAIHSQGGYPNWFSPYPSVEVAAKRSWGGVVDWALPLYPPDVTLPADLEAKLKVWQALNDPFKQAGAALQAVQEDVRYFGVEMGDNSHQPHAPQETWTQRYGDCKDKAYLLTILLRRMGLQAEPALVSTQEGRGVAEGLPAASTFNHVIVRLRIGSDSYWLDATLTQQRGDLRQMDLYDYGMALPIVAGSDRLVEVKAPAAVKNEFSITERFVPKADGGAVDMFVETFYRGDRAESARRRVRRERFEQMSRDFADYYRKRYGEVSIASPATVREDDAANTVVFTEHYLLANPWARTSGTSRVLASYAEALASSARLPNSMSRLDPMELAGPITMHHEVRVELPEGWAMTTVPETKQIATGQGDYSRVLSQDGRKVSLSHDLTIEHRYIDGAKVGDFLSKLRKVNDDLGADIVFGMPAPIRSSERDQRLKNLLQGMMDGKSDSKSESKTDSKEP